MNGIKELKEQIESLKQELQDAYEKIKSLQKPTTLSLNQNPLKDIKRTEDTINSDHKAILESLVEGIVFLNSKGEVEIINDGAKKITGANVTEFRQELGQTRNELVDENFEILPINNQPAIIALTTKKPVKNVQVGVKLKGATYQWLLVNAQPVLNANKEFLGVVSSFIDITDIKLQRDELKQAKMDLELSENSLKMAQEISHVGSFIWKIKPDRIEWSDELFRIFNVSRSDFTGEYSFYLNKIIYSEDLKKIQDRNDLILRQQPVEPLEYRIKLADGRTRLIWSHVGKVLCDKDGNPDIVVGVVIDITDRRKEEERKLFEQSDQQALRLESLRFLAGGIAHDFNNLLGGIYGYIDLALNESHDKLVQNFLEGALKSMGRARSLTDQLLTFTESGLPNKEITKIDELLVDTVNFVLSGSSITCDFTISKDLWNCAIDKAQIEQVIENIVLNAMQSMGGKGKIFISADNIIDVELQEPTKFVKITIRDTGLGMTRDTLDHIFEPFFTTKEDGHGLGLATSYSIIKKHDGVIKVESVINDGSIFTILIPTTEQSFSIDNKAQIQGHNHQGRGLILVLDDEEDIREILKINLQKLGYSVITKIKGEEILEFIQDKQNIKNIKSFFLDLTIPGGLGGKDIITDLRNSFPNIPIFVISGYSDDPIITRPQDYGFTASLKKPFIFSELEKLLSSYEN